jgi:hypothetical protein
LSEDKLPRSIGISSSNRLHSLRTSLLKEHSPKMEAGSKCVGLELFGDIHDENRDNQDFEDCPLHLDNYTDLRFFKRLKEVGSCIIAVLFACSFVKAIIFPKCSSSI